MKTTRLLTFAILAIFARLILNVQGTAVAGPIEDLPPGHWYEVPNSQLHDKKPDPLPPGIEGIQHVMDGWNGGVFDTQTNQFIVWGGGHSGYSGNEVYAFSMDSLSWSIIWGPTPNHQIEPMFGGTVEAYLDGNPASRHTYDNLVYDPVRHALWSVDGSLWFGGQFSSATWHYDIAAQSWKRLADHPDPSVYAMAAYDPVKDVMFKWSNHGLYEYNPKNDTWTKRSDDGIWTWYQSGEIDPVARKMVFVGGGVFTVFDVDTYEFSQPTPTGDTEIIDTPLSPGLTYDSKSRKLVAWSGTSAERADVYVLTIDGDSYHWTRVRPAAGNQVTPTTMNPNGTYSRFQYAPSQNVFVLVNEVDENVYVYRLTEQDKVKPGVPLQVQVGVR